MVRVVTAVMAVVLTFSVAGTARSSSEPYHAAVEPGAAAGSAGEELVQQYADDVAVVWYAENYRVDADEALDRLIFQLNDVSALNGRLYTEHPESFGGMWIDNDDGGAVHVALTEGHEHLKADIVEQFPRPELLVFHTVRYSEHELNQLLEEIVRQRDEWWFVGGHDLADFRAHYDVAVDIKDNRVVIEVDPASHISADDVTALLRGHRAPRSNCSRRPTLDPVLHDPGLPVALPWRRAPQPDE